MKGGHLMRYSSTIQILCIVFGGLPSCVVGVVIQRWLKHDLCVAYLKG